MEFYYLKVIAITYLIGGAVNHIIWSQYILVATRNDRLKKRLGLVPLPFEIFDAYIRKAGHYTNVAHCLLSWLITYGLFSTCLPLIRDLEKENRSL